MRLVVSLVCLALLATPLAAQADWRMASSENFVIYADDSEAEIKRFAEKLERYRSAMGYAFPSTNFVPSPSNRVVIYVVGSGKLVKKLYGEGSRYIGGFYVPRAGGSIAIIPPVDPSARGYVSPSERTLMHEYAHHFMYENAPYVVPRWFGEGLAEYFSTAKFEMDGAVGLGLPNEARAYEIGAARNITIEELLDSKAYAARTSTAYDNFYGRSWLLFHYVYSDQARRKQLVDYLTRLNRGEPELDSAIAAFGDLKKLDRDLKKYLGQRKWQYIKVPSDVLSVGAIEVTTLNEAEAASMAVRVQSRSGVDAEEAATVVLEARALATTWPDESEVQAALAEAEYDAGNDEAAIAAADKALLGNASHINALLQKGYALMRIATETGSADAWKATRSHFVAMNKIEPDHPVPLLYFYLSFVGQGEAPSKNAVTGLEWALQLAPYDPGLRMTVAQQQVNEKRYAEAIATLGPLAYSGHASEENPALKLLEEAKRAMAEEPAVVE
ncbi:MAG: DUF1570 domain-containing protein [Pseudomonadota bacterium]